MSPPSKDTPNKTRLDDTKARSSMAARILLWLVLLVGGSALGIWLDLRWFPAWFTSPLAHGLSFVAGLLLLRLVLRISRNTGRTLAHHGREGDLPRLETNRLVTAGPYACMRHPMHFGLLFFPLTLALLLGSLSFTLIIAPLEMLLMVAMILTLEEREALAKFGDDYRDYRQRVPAFSLSPACLRRLLAEVPPLKQGGDASAE